MATAGACGGHSSSDGKTLKVGVSVPFTGPSAAFGPMISNGLDLGVADQQKPGEGINIEFIKKDDGCSPEKAVTVVQDFVSSGNVNMVFGPGCSGALAATQKLMAQGKLVHVSGGYQSSLTKSDDGYYFRTVPNDTQLTGAMASYVADKGHRKIAMLNDDTSYGTSGAKEFADHAAKLGIEIVYRGEFKYGLTDFSGQVVRLRDAGADAFYFQGYEGELGQLVKQLRQLGLTQPIFGPTAMGNPEFAATAGAAADGVVYTSNYNRGNPATASFTQRYRDKYQSEPTDVAAAAYLAAFVYVEVVRRLGPGARGDQIVKAVRDLTVQTPLGTVSFDEHGDLKSPPLIIGTIKGGRPEVVADHSKS
jgi:branched-chain amino acid transport system substrate-binding protein